MLYCFPFLTPENINLAREPGLAGVMIVLRGVFRLRWAELRLRCCTSILVWDDWQTGCYAVYVSGDLQSH